MSGHQANGTAGMVDPRDEPIVIEQQAEDEDKHHSYDGTAHSPDQTTSDIVFRESEIPTWRFAFLCVGLCLGLLMAMMDASIVATSLYTIGSEFQDLERINWVALAYTLAFLGCSVFFASMADVVGRRNAFVIAFILFFSFSLGCGFAQNMQTIIACRVFQGVGGAGLFSVTMIIFPELTPPKLTNTIAPLIGMVVSIGGVLGPVLGGVFTKYASWRWVFWVNGPLGGFSMVLFYLAWPKAEHLPTIHKRSWKDMDFLGSLLVTAAAVLVTFAFQNAGTSGPGEENPWGQGLFIVPLTVGVVCWVGLAAWEIVFERVWYKKMAAIPLVLFRNHVFAASTLNTVLLGFAYLATLYVVPLRLQVVNGKSPITAGVMMLPMLGGTGIGSVLTGMISRKENRLSETMCFATAMVTLGLALETTVSDSAELEPKFLGFLVFVGLGYGMITSSATMMTAIESPIPEHASAQGIISQSRMLGGSIGIAISSAVLASQQRDHLAGVVSPSVLQNLEHESQQLTNAQMDAIRKTYNDSFTETMKVCAIVAGIGILITTGTYRQHRLPLQEQRRQQIQQEVARRCAEKDTVRNRASRRLIIQQQVARRHAEKESASSGASDRSA